MKNMFIISLVLYLSGCYIPPKSGSKVYNVEDCKEYMLFEETQLSDVLYIVDLDDNNHTEWNIYPHTIRHIAEKYEFHIYGERTNIDTGRLQYLVQEDTVINYNNSDWLKCRRVKEHE